MPLYIILLPSNFLSSIEDILNSHIVLAHITSKVILEVEALLTTMRPILTSKHNIIIKNDTVMLPLLGCRLIFGSYVMGLEFTSTHLLLSGNPYRNLITVIIWLSRWLNDYQTIIPGNKTIRLLAIIIGIKGTQKVHPFYRHHLV